MADELELINGALAELGQDRFIVDLEEDPPSRPLRVAQGLLPALRDSMLRGYPWLCAQRRRTLSALVLDETHGDWKFSRAYALPEDTLRVFMVDSRCEWTRGWAKTPTEERRDAILTNHATPLRVVTIERVSFDELDACLHRAMTLALAARMAGPLQADRGVTRAIREEADRALGEAISADVGETGNTAPVFESAWLSARDGAVIGMAGS